MSPLRHFSHKSTICCPSSCGLQTAKEHIFQYPDEVHFGLFGSKFSPVSSHSPRRGGAMLAYKLAIPVDTICLIGDWPSNAYVTYIEAEGPLVKRALHTIVSHALDP